jgi:hypothetical protein
MIEPKVNWFKINRALLQSDRWLSEPFTRGQAWIDLIGLAQHTESVVYIKGTKIEVKRGGLIWSKKNLALRWKWSRGKVDRFLEELEKKQDITVKIVLQDGTKIEHQTVPLNGHTQKTITTAINIVKYDYWQGGVVPLNGTQTIPQVEHIQEGIRKKRINFTETSVSGERVSSLKYPNAKKVREVFSEVLGNSPAAWRNKVQVQAAENLYNERGLEKVRTALEFFMENKDRDFCPQVSSPQDLDLKYAKLSSFKTRKT